MWEVDVSRSVKLKSLKRWLLVVLVLGLAAFSGTGGTFASFNAITTNSGNSISTGTLTLSDTVTSGTVCLSSGGTVGSAATNDNSSCTSVLTVTNLAPGAWNMSTQIASVTVEDTGSLDAGTFTLGAPAGAACSSTKTTRAPYVAVTGVSLTSGSTTASVTSSTALAKVQVGMPVLGAGVPSGTTVTAVGTTTVTMSQKASASESSERVDFGWSTTLSNVQFSANSSRVTRTGGFPGVWVGMTVTATGTPVPASTVVTALSGTSLTISQTATSTTTTTAVFGATSGTQTNFTATPSSSGYPLCSKATLFVQESATVGGTTDDYCWYGLSGSTASGYTATGTGKTESASTGMCLAPLSTTLVTNFSCATGTITLSAVTGPIFHGNDLQVLNEGYTCLLQVTSTVAPSTSSKTIHVTHVSGSGTFPKGAEVSDSTTAAKLNSDHTHTIKNFLSSFEHTKEGIILYPVSAPGKITKAATVQLSSFESRTFTIGLYLPETSGTHNTVQGLKTTFGLTWYITQTTT